MPDLEQIVRATRSFRNHDEELRPLSEWFRDFASDAGLAGSRLLDFELCLNELITNIVHYAYPVKGPHEIRVTLAAEDGEVRATIEDDGAPFNPLEKEAPVHPDSLENAGIGGWGIPIVRAFVDEISYERREARNRLTIVSRMLNP